MPRHRCYFAFNKPFGVLSQFSSKGEEKTLKDYLSIPTDVYPIGRLDKDSEGLLLLSNDKSLTNFLLNPINKHEKEYWVQVERIPERDHLKELEEGVVIDGLKTLPAIVKKIDPPIIWERIPPIRERKSVPICWLDIILIEGRNRQIRKMAARIGFPVLRLIRVRIKNVLLGSLELGDLRELTMHEINNLKLP